MRAQAAAALSMWSTSSSATTLIHRRVVSTVLPSSSSRLFSWLCRSISNRNNSSSSLTCNPSTTILPVSNSKMVVVGRRRWLSVRASNVSEPGSIDSPMILSMQAKIKEQLEADSVVVKDANGDGRHVSIEVVSKLFEGKSSVNRQRMVYKAIWEELQSTVHAVDQMTTQTPEEAKK